MKQSTTVENSIALQGEVMRKSFLAAIALAAALSLPASFSNRATGEQNTDKVSHATERPNQVIFVSSNQLSNPSVLYRVDEEIQGLVPIAGGFNELSFGTCGPDGYLYFAERGKRRIVKVSQDGKIINEVYRFSFSEESPEAPIFDSEGNLYFTSTSLGGIWRLENADPAKDATQVVHPFVTVPTPDYLQAGGLAFTTDDTDHTYVLAAHYWDNVVYRIPGADFCNQTSDSNCGEPKIFIEDVAQPYGVAVNDLGEIFASTYEYPQAGHILHYTADGRLISTIASAAEGISGLAFDHDQNLWFVSTRAVFKLTRTGETKLVTAIPEFGQGIAICELEG